MMEIANVEVMHYGKDGAATKCEIIEVKDDTATFTIPMDTAHVLVHDAYTGNFICKIVR
jgi:hypothetical protein